MELKHNYVIERINQLLKERNWTVYRLAKESGLAYSSLNNIFIRDTVPSVFTLEKICNGFQITLSQFFDTDTPIVPTADMLSSDERSLIETYRTLTKSDKQLLTAYLNGLAKRLSEEL